MAYKHIKYKAEAVAPDFTRIKVQILEQTHRGSEFGEKGSTEFYHAGISLGSIGNPAAGVTLFYVRGSVSAADNNVMEMSVAAYQNFKKIVEAYNEYFKEEPKKERRHIKVSAKPSDDLTTVEVTILEQTHFGNGFGNVSTVPTVGRDYAFIHEGIRIYSLPGDPPKFRADYLPAARDYNSVSLKGRAEHSNTFTVPIEKWPKVRGAIEAYNEFYKGDASTKFNRGDTAKVIKSYKDVPDSYHFYTSVGKVVRIDSFSGPLGSAELPSYLITELSEGPRKGHTQYIPADALELVK